jgi:hypothetical protein
MYLVKTYLVSNPMLQVTLWICNVFVSLTIQLIHKRLPCTSQAFTLISSPHLIRVEIVLESKYCVD